MSETIQRLKKVVLVLSKNGLTSLLCKYGFAHYLPFFKRKEVEIPTDLPERIRKSMEELGGGYIKLGQLLSVKPELVPHEYCQEFSKLQDQVKPESTENIIKVIEQEFKKPAKEIFKQINIKPIGSASVAQVHKARLKNGKLVAVKIQRLNIENEFKSDIKIIKFIAHKLQKHIHENINPVLIAEEFEQYTKQELDFTVEASHIDEIHKQNKLKEIIIPKVFWEQTTKKILTMQYLDGKQTSELDEKDKKYVAETIITAALEQLIQGNVLHADLHPGNILLLKNKKIGLIDFGQTGHFTPKTRTLAVQLYLAIIERNTTKIAETILQYANPSSNTNINQFKEQIENTFIDWIDTTPKKQSIMQLAYQLFVIATQNQIRLPSGTILIGKGLMTAEATAKQLYPAFDIIKFSQPRISKLLKEEKTPQKIINRFKERSTLLATALTELPTKALDTLDKLNREGVMLNLTDDKFRHLGKDINFSSNRLSYALISSSLILAAALMIDIGPTIGTYSMISTVSLGFASLFALALLMSIHKEHHPVHDKH
ncbi:hypothetical protein COV18_02320 [Candidatus Woesearchaeota archaeon CG10_big_fil_rev_8_21_14_0_10_37_12]|nr:MAG: hypothetical protein COV18_02320 [Candidatus Woesearchaeota archaeon CG10_big_fil_rev_8_21_14_0_10_37_12]